MGSFPSVKSREVKFYYGNPRNRFWKTLGEIYGVNIGQSVKEKTAFLSAHRLALWDIVRLSEIRGSSDSSLKCVEPVDLSQILNTSPIEYILCNGKKAYELFVKHYPKLSATCLPSTSPANARFDKDKWKNAFVEIDNTAYLQ